VVEDHRTLHFSTFMKENTNSITKDKISVKEIREAADIRGC
jgi:hypothetical protein